MHLKLARLCLLLRAEKCAEKSLERMNTGDTAIGLYSGFTDVDSKLNGYQDGKLYIIAARPGVGKTAFALNTAHGISSGANGGIIPGYFASIEMTEEELGFRQLASSTGLDGNRIQKGVLTGPQADELTHAAAKLGECGVRIKEYASLTPAVLYAKLRREIIENGIRYAMVDYLQLMRPNQKCESRVVEIETVTRDLKSMAASLKIPIIALAQLNRDASGRLPTLADLKGSGQIEQDAHGVIFIHRMHDAEMIEEREKTTTIIAKNRGGQTGHINMRFDGPTTTFHEIYVDSDKFEVYDGSGFDHGSSDGYGDF